MFGSAHILRTSLAFVAAVLMSAGGTVWADDGTISATEDTKRKINLAGRQRMLTQRISKSACLAEIGIDVDTQRTQIAEAVETFGTVLIALQRGSDELGMLEETNQDVLHAIDRVTELWGPFKTLADAATRGDMPTDMFRALRNDNVDLLQHMHQAVMQIQEKKSPPKMGQELAILINVSGKQRMLTQRTAKSLCMLLAGVDPANDRMELKDAVLEFEGSLQDLIVGNPARGILAAPTTDMMSQLDLIRSLWAENAAKLHQIIDGAEPTSADVARIAADTEKVLSEMNTAVWMYESL